MEHLTISTIIYANTVSNAAPFVADFPKDREKILKMLKNTMEHTDEGILEQYRDSIRHL